MNRPLRSKPLRRTAMKRRVSRATAAGRALFAKSGDVIAERAGYKCEGCGRAEWLSRHHRQPRQMGGSRERYVNEPANLMLLCRGCDEIVENTDRTRAKQLGWIVVRGQDPAMVPVVVRGRPVYLTADGGYREPSAAESAAREAS